MIYLRLAVSCISIFIFLWTLGLALKQLLCTPVLKSASNTLIGFIAYIALSQVVATPFLITNGNPKLFFGVLLTVTVTTFLGTVIFIYKRKLLNYQKKRFIRPDILKLLFLALVLFATILGLATQRYDIDDSYYLGMSSESLTSQNLYTHDPSTGISGYPMEPIYTLGSFELTISALSYIAHIPVAIVAHIIIALFVIALSLASYRFLLEQLFGGRKASYLAGTIFVIMLMFTGSTPFLSGNFILSRPWQGKSVLIGICVPIFIALCIELFKNIKFKRKRILACVLTVEIASFALSTVAIFLLPSLLLGVLLMRSLEMKSLRSRAILSFFIALAPILLYSIALKLKIGQSPYQLDPVNFSGIDVAKWQSIGVSFFGRSVTIVSFGLAASVLIWQKSYLKLRYFFGGLIIAFTIVANPLWAGQVADHITSSATYWRLFWVMLPELLIATFAYYLISHLAAGKLSTIGKLIVSIVMVAVVALLFGTFLFTKGAGFSKTRNIYKVPESAIAASNLPDGSLILADQLTAAYVRSVNPRIRVAYSRDGYMSFVLQNEELEFEALNGLFQAVNSTGPIPPYFTEKLLDRKIDYIVYTATNSTLVNFTAQDSHFKTVSKDRRFYIKRICSIDCSH